MPSAVIVSGTWCKPLSTWHPSGDYYWSWAGGLSRLSFLLSSQLLMAPITCL